AVVVVEGLGGVQVAVGVPPHLARQPVGAFLGGDAHHAGERVAVLGVRPSRDDVGARHRQVGDVGAAAEQRIGGLDAVELILDLARAPAAEVELASLGDDAGLGGGGLPQVVG